MKTIQLLFKISLSLILFICFSSANAQSCSIATNVNGNGGTNAGINIGQSFTACGNGRLSTISANAVNTSAASAIVRIHQGVGNGGAILGTSSSIFFTAGTKTWDLNSLDIQLVQGQVYTAMFYAVSGAPLFQYGTYGGADYYAGGAIYGAGAPNNDMFFWATITGLTATPTPAHTATNVSRATPLQIQFNLSMVAGTGDVVLKNLTTLGTETIPVANLDINGSLVTIPYTGILDANTQYEVTIPSTALSSTDGLDFDGYAAGEWTFTTTPNPLPQISSSAGSITNTSPISFTINFTEAVTGFDVSDLSITNGTPSNFSGSGTTYTVDITPTAEGDVILALMENVAVPGNETASHTVLYDNSGPTVVTQDISVQLDGSGNATILPSSVNNGSTDNFSANGDLILSLDQSAFTCSDLGANTVSLTVTDEAGNQSSANATVTVLPQAPVMVVQNYTAQLDATGNVIVDPANFDNGSTASCGASLAFSFVNEGNNYSLDFDGNDDNVTAPIPTGWAYNTSYTIEGWVKAALPGTARQSPIVFISTTGVDDIEVYLQKNTDNLVIVHNRGNGGTIQGTSFPSPPNNVWYHLAIVFNGSTVEVFYDGVSQGAQSIAAPLQTSGANIILADGFSTAWAGVGGLPSGLLGEIDEFRFWSTARSSSEINTNKDLCLTGSESGLEAYFTFENGTGTTVTDIANGNDGTMMNMDGNTDWVTSNSISCLSNASGAYSCADIGTHTVLLSADDGFGNVVSATATLTIEDATAPTIIGQDINAQLDLVSGTVSITPAMVDNGTSDNCSFTLSLDQTEFTCNDVGDNVLLFTAIDGEGNSSSVNVTVSVLSAINDESVTATDTYICPNGTQSTTIQTGSSQIGVDYVLRDDLDNVIDGPVSGDGNGISFNTGTINSTTNYNIYATTAPVEGNNFALDFDGSDDYILAPVPSNFNYGTSYTVEMWVKSPLPGGSGYYPPFFVGTATVSDIEVYVQSGTNLLYVVHNRGNGGTLQGASFGIPPNNIWYHLAIVYNGTSVEVFFDGVSQGSSTIATPIESSGAVLNMGYIQATAFNPAWGPKHMLGQIDDCRLWSSARSLTDINNNKDQCLVGNESGLEAYYPFEDGSALVATDITNGNNGALTNMDGSTDWVTANAFSCSSPSCGYEMSTEATVNLITIDNSTNVNGTTISATQTGATYRWLDCDNGNSVIIGATSIDYTPPSGNGSYAVEITLNNCTDTSSCVDLTTVGIQQYNTTQMNISPNPVLNTLNILTKEIIKEVSIYTINGSLIRLIDNNLSTINVSDLSKGMYILVIRSEKGITQRKFIKE